MHSVWCATARASSVFPVPGGPYSNTPWNKGMDIMGALNSDNNYSCALERHFSNSLMIQKPKTEEIIHHDMFLLQNRFVWEVISNTCHSVSSQYQKPWSLSKILRYASYFQLSPRCLICDETLCLVFDILLQDASSALIFSSTVKTFLVFLLILVCKCYYE